MFWFVASAAAEQWPRFRGPNGAGISQASGIPTTWSVADYKWRVKLPGRGHSSPVVWDKRIFVTSALEEDATRIIRCLNVADGQLIWKRSFASTTYRMNRLNSYAAATPAVDAQRVYLVWTTPEQFTVVALTQEKGSELWRRDLGPYVAQHGSGASPIVVDDLLIVTVEQSSGSFAAALDATSGKTRWRTDLPVNRGGYATPCIYRSPKGPPQLIVAGSEYGLISLSPQSGEVYWQLEAFPARVVGSPVVAAGLILASCGQGGGGRRLVAVRPGDPLSGTPPELVYEHTRSMPYVPTPVAAGPLLFLFADSGIISCLDAATGTIRWQRRVPWKFFGSPVRIADRIYCMSREGQMIVLAAADQYRLLAEIDLEEPTQSTPAIADGVMYLRTTSHLMALGSNQ